MTSSTRGRIDPGGNLTIDLMPNEPFLDEYPLLMLSGQLSASLTRDLQGTVAQFVGFRDAVTSEVEVLDQTTGPLYEEGLHRVLEAAAKLRIFSAALPRSLGGSGGSMLGLSIGLEQLSRRCAGIANLVATHGLALAVVGATGNVGALQQLAIKIVEGERANLPYLLSTAATEPGAGSDLEDFDTLALAKLQSLAVAAPGGYRLNGRKVYVSNGSLARAHIVVMPTCRERPRENLHAFLVPTGTPGLTVVRTEHKLGQRASPAAELQFDDCFVPASAKLSATTLAGRALDFVLGASRGIVGAFGAGIARGVYDTCQSLAERPFSSEGSALPIGAKQAILARMWVNAQVAKNGYIEALMVGSRHGLISFLSREAFRLMDRFVPEGLTRSSSLRRIMALPAIDVQARRIMNHLTDMDIAQASCHGALSKVVASECALENCRLSFDLLAANASRESTGLPKFYRDARLLPIYEGTNDICLIDIAKKLPPCTPRGTRERP